MAKTPPKRSAPNEYVPPHRPSDPAVVTKLKAWLSEEYTALQELDREARRDQKKFEAARAAGADVHVGAWWEHRVTRSQESIFRFYEILGVPQDVTKQRLKAQWARAGLDRLVDRMVALAPDEDISGTADVRGDPTSPHQMLIGLAMNVLTYKEIASAMHVAVTTVRSWLSRRWDT